AVAQVRDALTTASSRALPDCSRIASWPTRTLSTSRRLHLPPDVAEEAAHGRGRFALHEGPDHTLHEAGNRGVRGDRLREAHLRAVLRRPLENDRAADVGVVALDREALEADPVDAVALVTRRVAGHHAHRAGGTLPGDEAVGVRAH